MGEVIEFPQERTVQALLSKRQLARELGRSRSWVELQQSRGMPVYKARNGYCRYRLSDVLAWLEQSNPTNR